MGKAFLLSALLLSGWRMLAQTSAAPVDKTVEVAPSEKWVDTGIDLHVGDVVDISAQTRGSGATLCDPQGAPDVTSAGKLPMESALPGALIAKLQEKLETPVFLGAERQLKITAAGHLYLGANVDSANRGSSPSCAGKYSVKIHVAAGNAAASVGSKLSSAAEIWMAGQFGIGPQAASNPGSTVVPATGSAGKGATPAAAAVKLPVSNAVLDVEVGKSLQALPRRVNDEFKNPGDMVNFVLIGSEKQVQDALTAANWHGADTSTSGAMANAGLMATEKQDYLAMPMSQLYLFGRVQDFGYEMAEPYAMVASRHHFRIWKSTAIYKGQPVWAGAGTHDIGFEKDQRNGKVTHKIDPAVDGERDHIGESLEQAGTVKMMSYFTPSDPVEESKNATGGGFHSDGRVLVIFLQ
jgi:LssY-like putative type I secretion system component LssY